MYYWAGDGSMCTKGGSIDRFVRECFPGIEILTSDGVGLAGGANTLTKDYPNARYVGALCSRIRRNNLILLPLDDDIFDHGLFPGVEFPSWESRRSTVFWRGGASGYDRPSIRERVVRELHNVPHTDVKLTRWGGWENGKNIPDQDYGHRCHLFEHFNYKYIPIIDGNCIASNHQWVFGSGAVPLMISHPDNEVWFGRYIEPMVHYVPIAYDLSNLKERIEWLVTHDDDAKQIAQNAVSLARRIFSPDFQRDHLRRLIPEPI